MASYIVLARKWRPQTFADLVGQQHIAVTLQNAIAQNRVAHAFLFTGSRGVGKTSTARIFAKALNCEKAPAHEPCNECQSCTEITEGHSMDVIEIDGASNRGINEIREILDAVRYAPSRDRYKIYIIDEVHMLTTEAFNALLKTLEEPPPHVIFIFATTDPNKIPITIVSRCQRYDFKRIQTDDLVAHLDKIARSEGIAFEESALRLIARTARGGVRDALSAMDQIIAFAEQPITGERAAEVLGVASRETLMKMVEAVIHRNVSDALACINRVDHYGQNLSQFAFDLLEFLRDATVVAADPTGTVRVELNAQEREQVKSWMSQATFDRLQRIFNIWYQTSEMLPRSLSPKLVMEMAAIRMCQVETVVPIDGILRKIDAISKALGGQVPADALSHIQAFLDSKALGEGMPEGEKKKSDDVKTEKIGTAEALNKKAPESVVKTPEPQVNVKKNPENEPLKKEKSSGDPLGGQVLSDHYPGRSAGTSEEKAVFTEPPGHFPDPPEDMSLPLADMYDDMPEPPEDFEETPWNEEQVPLPEFNGNGDNVEKTLELSGNRLKKAQFGKEGTGNASSPLQRWKQVVSLLGSPLSTIFARARINSLTRDTANITLPEAYRNILKPQHIQEAQVQIGRAIDPRCRLVVGYDDIGDEAETLAAQEAKSLFDTQQKAFDQTRQHPVMREVMTVFHIDPENIRFTFNNDRTST